MKLYLKLCFVCFILFSCKKNEKNILEIKIRGLENCIQVIKIDEEGNGVFLRAVTKDNYKSETVKIDSTELTVNFKVTNKEVLKFLKNQILELKEVEKKEYSFLLGGQRYLLKINGKRIIDSYGSKSSEIHNILKKILPFLPKKLVYNC